MVLRLDDACRLRIDIGMTAEKLKLHLCDLAEELERACAQNTAKQE